MSQTTLVRALRSTWRKTAQHVIEQVARFVRLTILAAIPSIVNLISGGKFDWRTLLAFILPFAEVAYRQVFPALGAAAVDAAPGATIVPAEVGAPASTGDGGYGLVELLLYIAGLVLLVVGVIMLIVAAVNVPHALSVSGLILAIVGVVLVVIARAVDRPGSVRL